MFVLVVIALAIATEALTELLVKSLIFQDFREKIHLLGISFLSKVFSCGYCFSVWSSKFLVLLSFILYFNEITFSTCILYFLVVLVVHRLSNYIHNINDKYFDKYYSIKED